MKTELQKLIDERDEVILRGSEIADALKDDAVPDAEQRKTLRESSDRLKELNVEIAGLQGDDEAIESLRNAAALAEQERKARLANARPPVLGNEGGDGEEKPLGTLGDMFVRSAAYKSWRDHFPQGAPADKVQYQGDAVRIEHGQMRHALGMFTATEKMTQRTLITSGDSSAGDLVFPDWRGLLEPGLVRTLSLRQLVTVLPTNSDTIQYAKEISRVHAAAITAEATALTGSSGLKPEGALAFDIVTDAVRTIPAWVPATKRILADANGLRAYIDAYLVEDVAEALEDEMLTGDGTGEHFEGILSAGIQTTTIAGDIKNVIYAVRDAIRKVRAIGKTNPTAVALSPLMGELVDLQEIDGKENWFLGAGPFASGPATLWGVPRVESQALADTNEETVVVGDFRKAVLWDREDTAISVGTVDDDFIRNIVRVLAEMRAGFGVLRPTAFCSIDAS